MTTESRVNHIVVNASRILHPIPTKHTEDLEETIITLEKEKMILEKRIRKLKKKLVNHNKRSRKRINRRDAIIGSILEELDDDTLSSESDE